MENTTHGAILEKKILSPSFLCVKKKEVFSLSLLSRLSLQENVYLVAAVFPHKVLISARKCIFLGGISLSINHMPVTFLAEISATKFARKLKADYVRKAGNFRQQMHLFKKKCFLFYLFLK
jgi:hypothetical protein